MEQEVEQLSVEAEKVETVEQADNVEVVDEVVTPSDESETEEMEVSIDGEDEADVSSDDSSDKVARSFGKLRRKNKAVRSENDQLKQELAELRGQVGDLSRGSKPDILDYTNSEDFYTALDTWNGGNKQPPQQAQPQQQAQQQAVPDEVFDSHYGRAASLGVKDYEANEGKLRESLDNAFGELGGSLSDEIIRMSGDKSHLVAYALGANGGKRAATLISKLQRDNQRGTTEATEYILELKSAAKVGKKSKNINTQPEVIPEGRSNADALSTQISTAYNKWVDSGSISDHKAYKELKKQQTSK